jgi:microcystin-dependent protein
MDADTDNLPRSDILDLATKFNALIAMRGVADGVCDLDGSGKVPSARLPPFFPAGTAMLFAQTTAPTGWTKSTTHNDKALRVVNGTAGSGGSVAFTTAFASKAVAGTVGATTLTEAQMPSHTHTVYAANDGYSTSPITKRPTATSSTGDVSTAPTGGSSSHNHSFTGTAIDMTVQYVDVIIATKDA